MSEPFLYAVQVPADPELDPYRPVTPSIEVFGVDFSQPVAALLGAVWGFFVVLSTVRLFASLAASARARESGDADTLIKATAQFRAALIGLVLLLGAAIIVGGYVLFANTIINSPAPR